MSMLYWKRGQDDTDNLRALADDFVQEIKDWGHRATTEAIQSSRCVVNAYFRM
jgi:hypothetical protein